MMCLISKYVNIPGHPIGHFLSSNEFPGQVPPSVGGGLSQTLCRLVPEQEIRINVHILHLAIFFFFFFFFFFLLIVNFYYIS